jgi:mono/diheme cytochrome c family protein
MNAKYAFQGALVAAGVGFAAWAATAQGTTTWADVEPILDANCTRCHGSSHPTGLDLRSYASVLAGSNRGAVVVADDADNSLLVRKIRGQAGALMPRGGPALSDADIATIVAWVTAGMPE